MTYGKIVDAVFRVATLEEHHFTEGQEGATTETANLRDRIQRLAVLNGNLLRRLLNDNSRAGKMTEIDHPHPAVLSISHINTIPTMVFIQRTGTVVI